MINTSKPNLTDISNFTLDAGTGSKIVAIILGNGFDIANNFKTRYGDFVKSQTFNELLSSNNSLAKHISGVYNLFNWVDVELELGNYSFELERKTLPEKLYEVNTVFEQEYRALKSALYRYINSMTSSITNPKMKKLMDEWKNLTIPEYKTKLFIVTFNYLQWDTTTFLNESIKENLIGKEPLHIHGITNYFTEDADNIVLGVENTGVRGKSHNFIVKAFDSNTQAPQYFRNILKATKYIIFGCSIGGTDIRYFKPIFQNSKGKEFIIYGYGYKGLTDVQSNIAEICDFDTFITENEVKFIDSSEFTN